MRNPRFRSRISVRFVDVPAFLVELLGVLLLVRGVALLLGVERLEPVEHAAFEAFLLIGTRAARQARNYPAETGFPGLERVARVRFTFHALFVYLLVDLAPRPEHVVDYVLPADRVHSVGEHAG